MLKITKIIKKKHGKKWVIFWCFFDPKNHDFFDVGGKNPMRFFETSKISIFSDFQKHVKFQFFHMFIFSHVPFSPCYFFTCSFFRCSHVNIGTWGIATFCNFHNKNFRRFPRIGKRFEKNQDSGFCPLNPHIIDRIQFFQCSKI